MKMERENERESDMVSNFKGEKERKFSVGRRI